MVPHPPPPQYLLHFAHATVTKLTFPYFCMHAAVARRTFSFCWMNPLAGFGGSIARNCGEMQILSSRSCSAQCTGRFNAQQMESYTYIHIQVHIHIHTYTYMYIKIDNYIINIIYIYILVNIYVYIHIQYVYIHIHIHIIIHIS